MKQGAGISNSRALFVVCGSLDKLDFLDKIVFCGSLDKLDFLDKLEIPANPEVPVNPEEQL